MPRQSNGYVEEAEASTESDCVVGEEMKTNKFQRELQKTMSKVSKPVKAAKPPKARSANETIAAALRKAKR